MGFNPLSRIRSSLTLTPEEADKIIAQLQRFNPLSRIRSSLTKCHACNGPATRVVSIPFRGFVLL